MTRVFADASYFVALLNPTDAWHLKARAFADRASEGLVTTDWVLAEVASMMARPPHRALTCILVRRLLSDPSAELIAADRVGFERAFELFASRQDKAWSLIDCVSFAVMREYEVQEALTSDHHFEQAGFVALLK
jgi:predicted nucleic acid-binding protein